MRNAALMIAIVLLIAHPMVACAHVRGEPSTTSDGTIHAIPQPDGTVLLFDTTSGKKIAKLYKPRDVGHDRYNQTFFCGVVVSSFSPDGSMLATQRPGEPVILWMAQDGRKLASLSGTPLGGPFAPVSLEFSPDSRLLVAIGKRYDSKGAGKNRITIWEVATHKELLHVRPSEDRKYLDFKKATLSPDGKMLMAIVGPRRGVIVKGSKRFRTVKVWDIRRAEELVTLKGHSASFSRDGRFLFVKDRGSPDAQQVLWDFRQREMRTIKRSGAGALRQSK